MATIECTYGPVSEEVGGIIYNFVPDQFGRYVAEVWIDKHVKVFVSVIDHYRLVNKDNTDPWVPPGSVPPTAATLDSIAPDTAELGSEDLLLHCYGENFTAESVIVFNGGDEPTDIVSTTEITTTVRPSTASVAGDFPVLVRTGEAETVERLFTFTDAPLADLELSDIDGIALTDINGIGQALAQRLQNAGVDDVEALAALNKREMAALDEQLGLGGRSARDDWLGQAKKLAR